MRRIELDGDVHALAIAEPEVAFGLRQVIAVAGLHLAAVDADVFVPEQLVRAGCVDPDLRAGRAAVAREPDRTYAHPVARRSVVAIEIEVPLRIDLFPAEQVEVTVAVDVAEREAVVDGCFRRVHDAPSGVHVLEATAALAAQHMQIVAPAKQHVGGASLSRSVTTPRPQVG